MKKIRFKTTSSITAKQQSMSRSERQARLKQRHHLARLMMVGFFFVLLLMVLFWRLVDLTVLDRQFLLGQGDARSLRTIDIPAYRGMIMDREGAPLAVSTPLQSAWINPKLFHPNATQLTALARYLGMKPRQLSHRLAHSSGREFIYLQRQLTPVLAQKIEALKIPGLNFQQEFKRYYPDRDSMAQVVGFTNLDDNGIEGLELAYQDWLMGISGKKRVIKDRLGRVVEELDIIKEPRPGNDLRLSIDRRIQYVAFYELQNTLEKFGAKSGSVVVLDTKTGEILAVANAPSFNPNARYHYTTASYRNKAMVDTFEPGSVIKPFSIASALESGHVTPTTIIDTRPSWMTVQGHTIRDIHNYGVLDVTGVLQRSSNVGVTKMILLSPPEQLIGLLLNAGFGSRTESSYPGETDGFIVKAKDANPFVLATLGFGYGISVTPLQLAKSYLIFANQGRLLPVSLLYNEQPPESVQVIKPKTAEQVLHMMEAVLALEGTGKLAAVSGYRVAGKTGTARIAGKRGYEENRHIGSFVGIAPASNPRLIVAVVIHEPTRNAYYGGAVAAPLFSKVMGAALRILDIPPDKTTA